MLLSKPRSCRGFGEYASETVMVWSINAVLCSPDIAFCAAPSDGIAIKPKPFDRAVAASVIVLTDSISPNVEKSFWRSSSVAANERLPDINLFRHICRSLLKSKFSCRGFFY
jgi:hypothetical protein